MSENIFTRFICRLCGPREHPCEHYKPEHGLHDIEKTLRLMEAMLLEIIHILRSPKSATLRYQTSPGVTPMPLLNLNVGETANPLFQEWDGPGGSGNNVPVTNPVNYTSSNPAVLTADPSTGVATAVSNGQATVTGTDSGNGLSASSDFQVGPVAQPPVSATLSFTKN